MSKLSVVIITLNEEKNIGNCIDSVQEIADEIVVLDSLSTDNTCKIAAAKGARVIHHSFEGYVRQKNLVMMQAAHDYVFSIDADECLSEELRNSIKEIKAGFSFDGYTMNRLNFYCGQPIKTCGWYPDKKIRIWNKTKGEWKGVYLHERLELDKNSNLQHLNGDLLHYSFETREAFLKRTDNFAAIRAQELKNKDVFYLVIKLLFSAPFKFFKNYFFKLGFTDGPTGLFICYHQSREVFVKYLKALQIKNAGH